MKNVWRMGALALSILLFGFLTLRFSPYPALRAFRERPVSTRVWDAHGNLLQVVAQENGVRREFVPLEQIPPAVQQFFLDAEDRHFYAHHGIDLGAIVRATAQNAREGRTVSGASTITMQLVRIMRPAQRRTLAIKVREAFDTLRLEARLSKHDILELYLNSVPFGFNTEGVASAARTFFATTVDALSAMQASCLAVIPRRPARYNPLTNPRECAGAAAALYAVRAVGAETLPAKTEADFYAVTSRARSFSYPFEAPHMVRWLSAHGDSPVGKIPDVRTTLDLALQHAAEEHLARAVERYAENRLTNGAVLVCDTQTGAILAWVGSADFYDAAHNGQVDGILAARQPGSSMKPFLYALALEHGFAPSSVLPDIPLEFGFERLYVPQNFNNRFNGPVRLRVALASSLNVPAVYVLNELGMETYLQKLSHLHFDSLGGADPGLGLALGNAEVTLFELTQGFSVFARDGVWLPLYAIEPETDVPDAAHKKQRTVPGTRVYDENTARLICDMLSDADARALGFGYAPVFQTPFPSMFKTGTANQYQNITALGATPQYTVGVWMGNFSGETVVGKTGSSIPARIARDVLVLLQGRSGKAFAPPAQYKKEKICALSGKRAGAFCPDTVSEYGASGDSAPVCDWHTAHGIAYPAQYATWFRLKNRTGAVDEAGAPLTILSPRQGSLFYYDESARAASQNVIVEATGGRASTATFLLDATPLTETERPFIAQIPLVRGEHTVAIICGAERAEITFVVK